jgi:hypothetical protein
MLDANEDALYAGSTTNLEERIRRHRYKPWWPDVRYVTWQKSLTGDLLWDETFIVELLAPPHNTLLVRSRELQDLIWERRVTTYLDRRERGLARGPADGLMRWILAIKSHELRYRDLPILEATSPYPREWKRPAKERVA